MELIALTLDILALLGTMCLSYGGHISSSLSVLTTSHWVRLPQYSLISKVEYARSWPISHSAARKYLCLVFLRSVCITARSMGLFGLVFVPVPCASQNIPKPTSLQAPRSSLSGPSSWFIVFTNILRRILPFVVFSSVANGQSELAIPIRTLPCHCAPFCGINFNEWSGANIWWSWAMLTMSILF